MTVVYNVIYSTFLTTHPSKSLNRVVSMTQGGTTLRQMQTNQNSDKKHQNKSSEIITYTKMIERNGAVQSVEDQIVARHNNII